MRNDRREETRDTAATNPRRREATPGRARFVALAGQRDCPRRRQRTQPVGCNFEEIIHISFTLYILVTVNWICKPKDVLKLMLTF